MRKAILKHEGRTVGEANLHLPPPDYIVQENRVFVRCGPIIDDDPAPINYESRRALFIRVPYRSMATRTEFATMDDKIDPEIVRKLVDRLGDCKPDGRSAFDAYRPQNERCMPETVIVKGEFPRLDPKTIRKYMRDNPAHEFGSSQFREGVRFGYGGGSGDPGFFPGGGHVGVAISNPDRPENWVHRAFLERAAGEAFGDHGESGYGAEFPADPVALKRRHDAEALRAAIRDACERMAKAFKGLGEAMRATAEAAKRGERT